MFSDLRLIIAVCLIGTWVILIGTATLWFPLLAKPRNSGGEQGGDAQGDAATFRESTIGEFSDPHAAEISAQPAPRQRESAAKIPARRKA